MDDTAEGETAATPMMAQYLAIREAHPGCLLFYRMGDFFELFFEDAAVAARDLGIQLTKRGKHMGDDIAMAGVPVARAEDYLRRLIACGHRVAIAEQVEDPRAAKARGPKAVVARAVVRIVSPGTITEEALLVPERAAWLVAVHGTGETAGLAVLDISTGECALWQGTAEALAGELARLAPAEVLLADGATLPETVAPITRVPAAGFRERRGREVLCEALGVTALDAFGNFGAAELAAAAALIAYATRMAGGTAPMLQPPRRTMADDGMAIDAATRASLDFAALTRATDRCLSAAGRREWASRLAAPLTDIATIEIRLDAVAWFTPGRRDAVRGNLKGMPDLARALGRLAAERAAPRDLVAVLDALKLAETMRPTAHDLPAEIAAIAADLAPLSALAETLGALATAPPPTFRDAGIIRERADTALDTARNLAQGGREAIAGLQARYAQETGVRGLKVRHNAVIGWYVEVPAAAASALESAGNFRHRQTMAGAMRFSCADLETLEAALAAAAEEAGMRERALVDTLIEAVLAQARPLARMAAALARMDVYAALAELAATRGWCRPALTAHAVLDIRGGRHPVVEQALSSSRFVANDTRLGGEVPGIALVTGPNMAGKSTYLRQVALIACLAQAGSFVPAEAARIGIVDRLFSRVGAADDLARGRSTFMVEMVETAAILAQATERSLVILDEIGRGTATHDGLAIATAVLEDLHDRIRCRTLFATHYHELSALCEGRAIAPLTMAVKEWKGGIAFLHRVEPGRADRSYGIQVARLAGLPRGVTERAATLLAAIERQGGRLALGDVLAGLPLFAAAAATAEPSPTPDPLAAALAALDPDALSPREAHEALYSLKALAGKSG